MNYAVPLVDALANSHHERRVAVRAGAVLFVAALTAAGAQVAIPLPYTPVPLTFQPMVVLLGGLALGARLGMTSQVVYLLAGVAGLPVFAASATLPPGALRLLGPTGGYLLAYPVAAFATGYLAERGLDRRYPTAVLAMSVGLSLIYLAGASWLAVTTGTGFAAAVIAGVMPFLVADTIKIIAAAGILPAFWKLFGRAG
jgi:biotin transport system substrate-specific component